VIAGIRFPNNAPGNLNVYYNTINLSATSTGSPFWTAGIYHTYHATQALLDLRNNVIVNTSTPVGAGRTVAFWRSAATGLGNYSPNSNNNLFYAGAPSATQLIYYDGTNLDQILLAFQTRVAPREALSVTEAPPFLSTVGSNANFLKIDPTVPTLIESRGQNIAGITTDFEGEIRFGNAGYFGTGMAPDIGADEFDAPLTVIEVTASAGLLGPTLYPTLRQAFDQINNGTHRGILQIRVLGNTTETATAVLNNSGMGAANYTGVTLFPDATGRVISGNLATPLVNLSGADNVAINGSVGGIGTTADLTFRNTSTSSASGTSTVYLERDAIGNTISYCNLEGSSTTALGTNGGTLYLGDAAITNGNDNNVFSNNNIGPAGGNLPTKAVYFNGSTGSVAVNNSNCTFTNYTISD